MTVRDLGSRIIFVIACLLLAVDALSASRGISVQLRASESKNAEIVGEYRMYNESYALVVGIDEYTQGWPKLSNAVKDAELIAEALEEKGFEVDLHRNLDSAELMQVFKRFFILKGERPDARLFVWFAGHGATVDGEGYLVPADAPVISEGADFKFSSLALRDFGTYMRQSSSKHVYAVFDSCFAGTVFSAQRAMPPAAITRATALPVRQFLTSGDADQTVSDDGQFRELFIRAIRGEERSDANADGYLTASELGMYLGDRVTNLTESAQTPRYGKLRDRDFDRGDFVFALPTAPETESDERARGNETVFWNLIKDTGSINEYAAYLSQFPNGQFARQALIRQRQLEQSANLNLPREQFLKQGSFEFASINRDLVTIEQTMVRAFPVMESEVVGQLDGGTNVWGLGEYKSITGDWFDISHSGVRLGFIAAEQLQATEQTDRFVEIDQSGVVSDSSRLDDQLSRMMYGLLDESATGELDEQGSSKGESIAMPPPGVEMATQLEAGEQNTDPLGSADRLVGGVDQAIVKAELETVPDLTKPVADEKTIKAEPAGNDSAVETLIADPHIAEGGTAADVVKVDPVAAPEPKLDEAVTGVSEGLPIEVETAQSLDEVDQGMGVTDTAASAAQPRPREQGLDDVVEAMPEVAPEPDSPALVSEQGETGLASTDQGVISTSEPHNDSNDPKLTERDEFTVKEPSGVMEVGGGQAAPASGMMPAKAEETTIAEAESDASVQIDEAVTITKAESASEAESVSEEETLGLYARRYLIAALKGNIDAQFYLGYMYENGEHVTKDLPSAEKWYRRAAEMEHVNAMIRLASLLDEAPEATYWFRKAAENGDVGAQAMVAFRYESGTGTEVDLKEAVIWYKRAAEQDQIVSQVNLGRLYHLGIGVEKNLDQAIFWYEKAAKQGNKAAQNNLDQLLPSLN